MYCAVQITIYTKIEKLLLTLLFRMHTFVYRGAPVWKNCIEVRTAGPPRERVNYQVLAFACY